MTGCKYFVLAAVCALALVGCADNSKEQKAANQTATAAAQAIWDKLGTQVAQTATAGAPTRTPLPTLTPTPTWTSSPTATPSATATPLSEEEIYFQLYEQAKVEGRATECQDSARECPDEPLTYLEALLSLLKLPAYTEEKPLAIPMVRYRDLTDPELMRRADLAISLGLYPAEIRASCSPSDLYVCPNKTLNRETAVNWLGGAILGTVPIPCRDSFVDTDSPWVESLVCPLGFHRIGLNDPRHWGARDPISKRDWDVIKEQFLAAQGGS